MKPALPQPFNNADILRYANIAKSAYADTPALSREFADTFCVHELPNSRLRLLLINHGQYSGKSDIQWVSLRGTANLKNVVVDAKIKIIKEPLLGVYVHGGVLRAAKEAHALVREKLDVHREVRICGHSLGGAVAVVLAALLSEDPAKFKVGLTVTFGQPMVTDRNGVKRLQKYPLLRIVNHWDPVAILPLILSRTHFELLPTIFYCHVGPQLTLYKDAAPAYSPANRLFRVAFPYKKLLVNHSMDLYLQRLNSQTLTR